ncbi:MAG: energy-coupling factor transporter transmembrane component T [Bacillota bacterium]|nr:energy-coupling factor transporter transmembrane component T [Bacillota bacterium]
MKSDVFGTYHPAITFLFFIAAIVFGMCFSKPAFLVASCVLSAAYLITIKGTKAFRYIAVMALVCALIALINPLFNIYGEDVLMTVFGRPYTMEALTYGFKIGAMFATILLWFAAYNAVMTSDKFLYLFGRAAPSITLVLTMILRLIPLFQKKAFQIAGARKCVGLGGTAGTRSERINNGMAVTSALTSWALEGGIVTADSMSSRGFGCGRRSTFSIYRFDSRDKLLMIIMIVLAGASVLGILAAYAALLAIPTLLNVLEEIKWRNLRSKI